MTIVRDLRLVVRRLVRQPTFAVVAILTLAFGIGANLAVFALADAMLLAPIAAPDPDRLVRVYPRDDAGGFDIVSWPNYADARDGAAGLDLAAHATAAMEVGAAGEGGAVRAGELVSGNYFRVLGLSPIAGRLIDERDDESELAHPVVVVSEAYWRAAMGADPAAVGGTLRLNGTAFQVVGIAPRGFHGTFNAHPVDLWVPIAMQQAARPRGLTRDRRGWGWLSMIGRLRPGADRASVQQQLTLVAQDIDRRFPPRRGHTAFTVVPALAVADNDREVLGPMLGAAFAFTALVFIVTCANLGGVMQARLSRRRREVAIRQSLGAGRARLIRDGLLECVVIGAAGGVAALAAAWGMTAVLTRIDIPASLVGDLRLAAPIGGRVVAASAAFALTAALLFGTWPVWRVSRTGVGGVLKDDGASIGGGRRGTRARRVAIAVQVAVSVVLLVASGLLVTSLARQDRMGPGFETSQLGVLTINPQRQRVPADSWPALAAAESDAARRDPGVVAADLAFRAPLSPGGDVMQFRIPGYVDPSGDDRTTIDFNAVGAGYFEALGVPLVAGSSWDPLSARTQPAAVINETMARRFFRDDPVGSTIELVGTGQVRITGVARDFSYYDLHESPMPYIFLAAETRLPSEWVLHVRTSGDPAPVLARLQTALPAADPRLAPYNVQPFESLRRAPLFPARLLAAIATTFGVLALVLTSVGLYGVVSSTVAQRTREIGLRLALGAAPKSVLGGVLLEAGWLAAAGAAAGLIGGYFAAGALGTWLVGVSPFEPVVYLLVSAALLVFTLAAALVPARRAARIDPLAALRAE